MDRSFEMVEISDSDEPEEAIVAGMWRSDFDGVLLALAPDGEVGETGWYDTPDMADGRPTRPVLLFHRGYADAKSDGMEYLSEMLEVAIEDVAIVAEWERGGFRPTARDNRRTLEVHMTYPPYPWFDAAVIGMSMGTRFDDMEMVDSTEPDGTQPATYTYEFWHSSLEDGDD